MIDWVAQKYFTEVLSYEVLLIEHSVQKSFYDTAWENTISWGQTEGPIALH